MDSELSGMRKSRNYAWYGGHISGVLHSIEKFIPYDTILRRILFDIFQFLKSIFSFSDTIITEAERKERKGKERRGSDRDLGKVFCCPDVNSETDCRMG